MADIELVIKIPEEMYEIIQDSTKYIDEVARVCEDAVSVGTLLPKGHGWIPVSEGLPEDEQEILFSTKTGRVHNGKYHDDDSVNQWYSHRDKCRAWNNVVTAWMPLPKPYQSEIWTGSEGSDKVNCDKTECCNCVNHGCCDYEAESEDV